MRWLNQSLRFLKDPAAANLLQRVKVAKRTSPELLNQFYDTLHQLAREYYVLPTCPNGLFGPWQGTITSEYGVEGKATFLI